MPQILNELYASREISGFFVYSDDRFAFVYRSALPPITVALTPT
jgi:hypothetical protein